MKNPPADLQLLKVRDVCDLTGLARSSVYRLVRAGRFPPPIHISPSAPRWRRAVIAAWLNSIEPKTNTEHTTDRAPSREGRSCNSRLT